jgi:hypothetical protein
VEITAGDVMPIHKIEVSEFECVHCGYKWINRINGKDGLLPDRCAKCKRRYWNNGCYSDEYHPITPKERSLRVRLYKFEGYNSGWGGSVSYRPNEFCRKFLEMNPRPTIRELEKALYPLGWDLRKHIHYIPDPEKPNWLKYDVEGYKKLLEEDAKKRRQIMTDIMKSRGIDYEYSADAIEKEMKESKKALDRFFSNQAIGTQAEQEPEPEGEVIEE